jgi:hypothetical protein
MRSDDARRLNHHLWWNRGLWWTAFTVLYAGHRQDRIRIGLGTRDVAEARARRDALMNRFQSAPGCELRLRPSRRPQATNSAPPPSRRRDASAESV